MENLFFDLAQLKSVGRNVIIGKTVRIRYPELVSLGDDCILDDFTYISTRLEFADHVHVSAGCKIIGGREAGVSMGSFSTLAPNVVLSAGSDDYLGGLATPMVPRAFKGACQVGTITLGRHCIVGAGSVVLPNVTFLDGASVGALSLVKSDLAAWSLYAGIPARKIKDRRRAEIERLEREFRKTHG